MIDMILVKNNFPYDRLVPFSEVDVNGQPAGDDAEPTDYTNPNDMQPVNPAGGEDTNQGAEVPAEDTPAEGGDNAGEEDYTQENPPEEGGENPEGAEGGGEGDPEDFTAEQPPEDGGGGKAGGGGGAPAGGGDNPVQADDARGLEQEIFKDLTPDQLDTKHKELKSNFTTLFDTTNTLIDRINDIPTSEEYTATITFITTKLSDLREMITDYMNDVYSTKSYMENAINYNKFLAILKAINDVLEEINSELSKETDK